jgi:murein DD-endopeptidase MepM/ murein hydrolase activator NlpD
LEHEKRAGETAVAAGSGNADDRAQAALVIAEAAAKVRRAAALALRRLLQGDPSRLPALDVLGALGPSIRDLYRCLLTTASAAGEEDEVVRGHAKDGLAAVEDRMEELLARRAGPLSARRDGTGQGPALTDGVPALSFTTKREGGFRQV